MFCGVAILFNGAPCGFLGEQEAVIKPKSTKGHVTFSAILSYRQVVFVFRYHIVVLRCNQTQIINQRSCHHPFVLIFSSSSCRHQPSYSIVISLFFLSCRNHSLLNNQRFQNIFIFLKSERPSAWTRPLSVPDSISWLILWRWLGQLGLGPANSTFCQYSPIGGAVFLRECNFRGNGADLLLPNWRPPPESSRSRSLASKPAELCTQHFITEGASRISHWRGDKNVIFKMDVSPYVVLHIAGIGWIRYLWVGWGKEHMYSWRSTLEASKQIRQAGVWNLLKLLLLCCKYCEVTAH